MLTRKVWSKILAVCPEKAYPKLAVSIFKYRVMHLVALHDLLSVLLASVYLVNIFADDAWKGRVLLAVSKQC